MPHCGARTLRNPITTTVTSTVSSSKNGRRATEKKERNAHAHALRVSFPLSSLLIGGLTGFLYRVFFFIHRVLTAEEMTVTRSLANGRPHFPNNTYKQPFNMPFDSLLNCYSVLPFFSCTQPFFSSMKNDRHQYSRQ